MSYTTDRYDLDGVSFSDITIYNCGITENHPLHTSGKRVYNCYSMSFIVEGKGVLKCEGKEYHLSQGEGFIIIPGVPTEYIGDEKEPWKYVYVSFLGTGAEKLLSDSGLGKNNYTFSFPEDADTLRDIYAMHASGKNKATKGYGVLGYFFAVVSRIVAKENTGAPVLWSPKFYVEKAKKFIFDNYMFDISVENVADYIGVDRTYLYRLFLKYEGRSPSKYIWDLRLDMAAKKLKEDETPVTEVALSSGFGDVSHFYKAFMKKYGISPKKYREEIK